jgi:large subunit ribosomal protein L18
MKDRTAHNRLKRKVRIRKKIGGTDNRPRLTVTKSLKHIYAQIIDDSVGKTLVAMSTLDKDLRNELKNGGNISAAKKVGEFLAQKAQGKGIQEVAFDRNGYVYHGRVKALADAAREKGLKF